MKKIKSNTEVLNLDTPGTAILKLSKANLTDTARNLVSGQDALTEYQMLYKLQFLIKTRLEMMKDSAKETFLEKFGGSKTERENGFTITLKETQRYDYSEAVLNLETEIKLLQEQLKQMKEKEKDKAKTGEIISENLTFTLQ